MSDPTPTVPPPIVCYSLVGGAGCTTLAFLVALELADVHGSAVLVSVDVDAVADMAGARVDPDTGGVTVGTVAVVPFGADDFLPGPVVFDVGTGPDGAPDAAVRVLVTTTAYTALRRAGAQPAPDVVAVRQLLGRSLTTWDVAAVYGPGGRPHPRVIAVEDLPAVARASDAGLLPSRVPRAGAFGGRPDTRGVRVARVSSGPGPGRVWARPWSSCASDDAAKTGAGIAPPGRPGLLEPIRSELARRTRSGAATRNGPVSFGSGLQRVRVHASEAVAFAASLVDVPGEVGPESDHLIFLTLQVVRHGCATDRRPVTFGPVVGCHGENNCCRGYGDGAADHDDTTIDGWGERIDTSVT